jgi:ADP-heptose:LPS heptosyltransferase
LKRRRIRPAIGITSFSNAETNLALLNAIAGQHIRLGHTVLPGLYHLPQKYDHTMSLIHNNLCLVTIFHCPTGHVEPRVFFRDQDVAKVRDLLREKGILKQAPLTLLITQDSGGRKTGWQAKRFAQVIRYVSQQSQIIFVGTAQEAASIESLRTEAAVLDDFRTASLAGETTVPQLAALLCMADYAISLDTGAMHVGRAAEVPMVVLAPSWRQPLKWLPLGMERIRIVRGEDADHVAQDYRLDEIEAHHVIQAFAELMRLYPPSDLERAARLRDSSSTVDHAGQA